MAVAQLAERLLRGQEIGGSNPVCFPHCSVLHCGTQFRGPVKKG